MADNKDKKVLNVPALRFPEFSREWKRHKLSEICSFYSGGTPSSSKKEFYNGNIPFIRSGELHKDKTELFITEDGLNSSAAKLVEIGDLLLALYGATSGDIAISKIKGAINQAILCIRTKQNKKFIESVWNKHVERLLQTYLQGGQGNLSADIVKNIPFYFADLEEQDKLANFISLLDERISTQNKIIEKLETLIKGFVDSIFTANKFPKVPFKEIYVRAGEGGTPATSNPEYYDNGTIPFIKIDDLQNKYIKTNKDCITELGLQKSSAWIVPANSIIYSNGATIGAISINLFPVCTKQGILGVVPKADINVEFLYYFMTSTAFTKAVERIVTEGTMRTAYLKDINHIPCPVPYPVKQDEIAKMLSTLSEKLENEVIFQMKLQKQKEFLLSQMFI
ncbi:MULTISPECIES: restriction endonuclease subunit S [Bacteroidaceae]|uniref:Restriction endonuclease subunit S n=1 Tax=Bacteroides finegoldii TaxID=338188 RepID=A0A7J4YIN5_9BACE|nr:MULTISPECIES: restriction endonuclease subunit S [Bacteroides]KAA5226523.1 restriction endonuclease subunit S [Bacteroides finegoldii]KAA5253186.1 restriction endonuclease subunit S [Bacteroides finegoldii]RHD99546.1 restriction endonuclease subunit S [Bacteroides ovatus]